MRRYQKAGIVDPSIEALTKAITFKNRNLPWVDRAMNPAKYPVSNQDEFMRDGKVMSHMMAWGEGDNGEYQVFPTIGYKDGRLVKDDRQQPITVRDRKLAEFLAENGIIDHRKQFGGVMRKNKSMYQCMKCGGLHKASKGGESKKEEWPGILERIRTKQLTSMEHGALMEEYFQTPEGQKILKNSQTVFGPGNTVIGRQIDDIFFPSMESQDRAKVNDADNQLLKNKEELRTFLKYAKGLRSNYVFKKGGPTIAEINRGLPMRQLGGIGIAPYDEEKEYNQAPPMNREEQIMESQRRKGFMTHRDVDRVDPHWEAQKDYTQSVDELFKKYPRGRFNNKAEWSPTGRFGKMSNMMALPSQVNTVFRTAANMFGPAGYGYESNPLDSQWGDQSFGDTRVFQFGGDTPNYREGGNWIQKAVNPAHKGYCTPMTKSTCTPRRKAFAMTMKKHHGFHDLGGYNFLGQIQNDPR